MTVFLALGVAGILLLILFIFVDDHLGGIFDALGGGDWFTGASLAGFLGALGFGGAAIYYLTRSLTIAVALGMLLGLALGVLTGWVMLKMRRTQDGGAPTSADLVGREGVVITTIPDDGFGEIRLTQAGHLLKLSAKAAVGLASGTPVVVDQVLSPTSVLVVPTYR